MPTRHANELFDVLPRSRATRWSFGRIVAVLVLAALCWMCRVLVFAQTTEPVQLSSSPASPPAPGTAQKFTVTGTVIDTVTSEPIRRAMVQLNGQQRRTTFSDGEGRFQFEGILAGVVSLSAQKPGYFSEQEVSRHGAPPVEVGPSAAAAVVKLTPEAIITGRITTTAGVPIEHVSLSLNYIDIREGRRRWELRGNSSTDEDGRYRFANLRPGSYYVNASPYTPRAEIILEGDAPPKTGYPGAYYPGVPDLASASPIQLSAGQQAEANLSLNEVPVYSVSGTVSGYAANQGVAVQLFDQSGVQVPTGVEFNSENGRFDVHALATGSYVLKVSSSMGSSQPVRAEARFTLASDLHNLHLALGPELSIPVVVSMESKVQRAREPVAYSRLSPPAPPVSVRLIGIDRANRESYASFEGPQNQQNLVLRNVEPGRYSLVIDARGSWYVASAEFGQTNLLTDDLVLTAGTPPLPLNIVLRNDSALLTGTVHLPDGSNSQVTVVAVPQNFAKASPGVTYYYPPRDKNGENPEFMLASLAPGDYMVFAFDNTDAIEYGNRDVLQNYSSQAAHVTLAPGQRAKVMLELIQTGEATN